MSAVGDDRQEPGRYLQGLRQHWQFIVVSVVLAVVAAAFYSALAEKRYEAEADVLVTPVAADDEVFVGLPVIRESGESRTVLTAARLVKKPQIADAVNKRFGLRLNRDALLSSIDVKPQEQSNIVTITGTANAPARAALLANGFADVLLAQRTAAFQRELRATIGRLGTRLRTLPPGSPEAAPLADRLGALRVMLGAPDPTLQIATRAFAPSNAVWPRPVLSIAVALLAGLLLGTGLAVALELVNPLVLREGELEAKQRLPILGRVPRSSNAAILSYLRGRNRMPADVRDAYRTVRVNLSSLGPDHRMPRTLLVTSASRGEGKTTSAASLALALALAGMRVALVDANLRRPMIATIFGVAEHLDGLGRVLSGESDPEEELVPAPRHRGDLQLLLASSDHASFVDLLESPEIDRVIRDLKQHADVVVFDSPPLTEVADALRVADAVDAIVVVARLARSRRARVTELLRILEQRGLTPAGFVVITRKRSRRTASSDDRSARKLERAPTSGVEPERTLHGTGASSESLS